MNGKILLIMLRLIVWISLIFNIKVESVVAQEKSEVIFQTGHSDWVYILELSNDGKLLLTIASDKSVKLWDYKSGKLLKNMNIQKEGREVKFSPCGKYIAISSIGSLDLWDASLSKVLLNIANCKNSGIKFSSDGRFIAALTEEFINGQWRKMIKIWNVNNGSLFKVFNDTVQLGSIQFFEMANRQNLMAYFVGTYMGYKKEKPRVMVYDFISSEIKSVISTDNYFNWDDMVEFIRFSPDDKMILLGMKDESIRLYDVATGKELKRINNIGSYIRGVLSPDGNILALLSENQIRFLDIHNNKEAYPAINAQSEARIGNVSQITYSKDNKHILLAFARGKILLYNITNGVKEREFGNVSRIRSVREIKFSPNGKYIACGISDSLIRFLDLENLKEKRMFAKDVVVGLDFSSDNKFIASGDLKGNIKLWDPYTQKELYSYKVSEKAIQEASVFFHSANNRILFSADEVGFLDLSNGNVRKIGYGGHIAVCGEFIAGSYGSQHYLINSNGQEIFRQKNTPYSATCVSFSCSRQQFAIGNDYKTAFLYDTKGNTVNIFRGGAHTMTLTSLSFSPDGKYLATGSFDQTVNLWNIENNKYIKLYGHNGGINALAFSPCSKKLASGSWDGALIFWDVNTGKELVRYYSFTDPADGFIAITPDYYYFGNKNALKNLNIVFKNKAYSFDQYDLQYNRPDIILERLGMASLELIQAFRKAYEKRLQKMGFDPANFENEFRLNAPEVKIKSGEDLLVETNQPSYTITFSAEDKLYNLDRYFITVNGVPLYGIQGKKFLSVSQKAEQTVTIPLSSGMNTIKISVLNQKGVESLAEKIEVVYKPAIPVKPGLYVIGIGVSNFKQSEYNLTYADKDAGDIVNMFKQQSNQYGKVKTFLLQNQLATVENILALRSELEKTRPDDQVVIFIATHGLLDNDLDYYLATYDVDFSQPQKRGLRYDRLEALLDGIPARKKMVLIDACHSGEVDKEESQLAEAKEPTSSVKTRAFKKVVKEKEGIGLQSSFELMKELFTDLRRNNGSVVISSAGGKEYAFESAQWKNGVFTYAVLEGLKTYAADRNYDRKITVTELRDYVGQRVQALTNGKQNPTNRTDNPENDFIVW